MKILSLFDGISCARVALERAGIPVCAYYASEIDKYAIEISRKNYPDILRVGDVKNLLRDGDHIIYPIAPDIDLLIGGSPCQDLSIIKKDRKGLSGDKSGLFWEYVRILKETKPKYFILENVNSMDSEAKDMITKTLGVEPIVIDANPLSAQSRKRIFWTNIPNVTQPENKNLYIKDIMEKVGIDITQRVKEKIKGTLSYKKTWSNMRTVHQKAKTLTASGQNISNTGATNIDMEDGTYRKLTPIECERLQGLPDNYTEVVSNTQRYKSLGNAFNVDVVAHILSFIPKKQ